MANIGELSVGVKVDQTSLNKATKDVQTQFKNTGDNIEQNFTNKTKKGFAGIGSSLSGLGGVIAGVFSVGAIVGFTKQLFSLGSDLTEVSSKFDVVFKGSEKVKQEFQNMADATNRSNLDLITFGSSIGNVLAPMGLAQEEVDGLSVGLTKLAIDVASFQNASDEQAVHAFTSALTGERESLKSLGIVISEADVQNKAYSLGLATQGAELTKAQKALSTYQLLIENTANAHGDAIRTADSFANQLKGLRGAIKDVFANAGKDVAGQTAGLLKNITVFVSSYGGAIIDTIVETGRMIGSVIGDLFKTFGDLFGFIRSGTGESGDDMNNFAFIFMKVVQGFGVGVKFIGVVIKSLVNILAIALAGIVEYFMATFNSISQGWNIVKTMFVGTMKSIVDVVVFGAEAIGQVFVGMAEAIVGVFKGIADNVGVAVKKATNLAIKGINGLIDLVNQIPGVDINRLAGFDDANFKPFELKVSKNINALKGKFEAFGNDIKGNYAGIGASFNAISSNFAGATANVVAVTNGAVENMGNDWGNFATEVQASNDRITKSLEDGANKSKENAKKYDQGYFSILDLIDKYKGGVDEANKKTAKQGDVAKETMGKIKDLYKEWENKVDDLNKAQEKLAEDTKKYNQDIEDSLRSLNKELENTTAEYKKAVAEINKGTSSDLAERSVAVQKDLLDTEKQIAEIKSESALDQEQKTSKILDLQTKINLLQLKINENTDKTSESTKQGQKVTLEKYQSQLQILQAEGTSVENQEKLAELEKQKTDLLKEQQIIIANTTEDQRKEAERVAGLTEAEKIKEDADKEIAEKTRVFEEEKAKIESLQRINKVFLGLKKLDEDEYNRLITDARFLAMTQEEQELILKLAREKMQLTMQKDAIIMMQQEVHDATVELSNSATAIQQANINSLKSEYATLIAQIQTAIAKQRELNALKGSKGFASGGFTGSGGASEVAGVVHKGEWVAPKWMVNSMKPLFDNLEASRTKGFASGGYTNTTNKTQNNNITVNSGVDLRSFIDYAKWKL